MAIRCDRYSCFDELRRHEEQGRDFVITTLRRESSTCLILAPHGGGIEHGTSDIARAIAGENFNLYLFEGIKAKGNADLHVTSSRFDEQSCLEILSACDLVVAIHGCKGEDERVLVGGLHRTMNHDISDSLQSHGVHVEPPGHRYPATDPMNICNRGRMRQGVQLEISAPLRRNPNRHRVVNAVRAVLLAREAGANS
jgi:phage replication-related protein YjqB (UPF0714/DUF867 family)